MSLTVLVHKGGAEVMIVEWFLDPRVSISYPNGPLIQMPMSQFKTAGWDKVKQHFAQYAKVRLREDQLSPVFNSAEEKKQLKKSWPIRIRIEESGELTLIPQGFRNYDLAALQSLGQECRRSIPFTASADVFWKAFEDVLAFASNEA